MNVRCIALILCLALLLSGCGPAAAADLPRQETTQPTETQIPTQPATIPADGTPGTITALGSYTGEISPDTVVARAAERELTLEALQAWYWAEAAQWEGTAGLDLTRPLDAQKCTVDDSVASWQQFFLNQALKRWHTAVAMEALGQKEGTPTEEAFQPEKCIYRYYIDGMPASKVLYGYAEEYVPNSMHRAYLDGMEDMLEEKARELGFSDGEDLARSMGTSFAALAEYGRLLNWGYMYFTTLSYYIEPEEEEITQWQQSGDYPEGQRVVDHHQIWLAQEDGESQEDCVARGEALLKEWASEWLHGESTFAQLANEQSQDETMAVCGGAYEGTRQGDLLEEIDQWLFAPERQAGDTGVVPSQGGCYVLHLDSFQDEGFRQAKQDYIRDAQVRILSRARGLYPMEVTYEDIRIAEGTPSLKTGDVLYADVAHERFPEVPLYLQQDYADTMYGAYKITSNGCGITSMAMLASYMADDELTPPEMCERFGHYSFSNGTDGALFQREPGGMGFFLLKKTYEWREARDYLNQGYIVICVQHAGYWTRGGHYLVLEKALEDGMVQVRDSNIYNYARLSQHKEDKFDWNTIAPQGHGYWIYQPKVTTIAACARCGDGAAQALTGTYTCQKCQKAVLRREVYLQ